MYYLNNIQPKRMEKMKCCHKMLVIILATLFFMTFSFLIAEVPHLISYQGVLTDGITGIPVLDGYYGITFKLYNGESNNFTFKFQTYCPLKKMVFQISGENMIIPNTKNMNELIIELIKKEERNETLKFDVFIYLNSLFCSHFMG